MSDLAWVVVLVSLDATEAMVVRLLASAPRLLFLSMPFELRLDER